MRSVYRRGTRTGIVLCLVGAALLLLGTAASVGYAVLDEAASASREEARAEATRAGGLELRASLDLDAPLVPDAGPIGVTLNPPSAEAVPLPGLSVDREADLDKAGLGLGAGLDLAAGSHRVRSAGPMETATQAAQQVIATPTFAPTAVAAAAFTLAGLATYFWTGIKAWTARLALLPAIGLYAKISRAEVFDNSVRERIFAAIRANPGISASDLARVASVSWGTTIYHLDVLEQTQMVSSLRKGRYRRYFENGAALTQTKDIVATLRNPVTASVVEAMRARPGVTQKDLAAAVSMTPQALHWHLARLVQTGLVRKEREGRVVRHYCATN